jgi:DNA-directed RNA polymerase beta' subunit
LYYANSFFFVLVYGSVDFSARTVITPDSHIHMSEVGIPYDLCMKMTYREIVNSHNIDDLTQRVHNGPGYLHGAQTVIMDDNTVIHLDSVPDRSQINLKIGWAVERHLKKGDLVTMNRQPSLRRVSMMRHKVVPLPGKTFRLNLSVCAPYNADFDGDEMNLGVV